MSMTGKKHSEQTKAKIAQSSVGNKSFSGRKHSEETKLKISLAGKRSYANGRVSFFQGKRPPNQPPHLSMETRLKISQSKLGEKNHMWKGGKSHRQKVRHSLAYKQWREDVFAMCDNRCVMCGIEGDINSSYLIVDHIKPYAYYPELRTQVSNGRVLCLNCHSQTDTYGGRVHKTKTA
jgi:hypothetical protein